MKMIASSSEMSNGHYRCQGARGKHGISSSSEIFAPSGWEALGIAAEASSVQGWCRESHCLWPWTSACTSVGHVLHILTLTSWTIWSLCSFPTLAFHVTHPCTHACHLGNLSVTWLLGKEEGGRGEAGREIHSWMKSVNPISFHSYGFIKTGGRQPQAMLRWMSEVRKTAALHPGTPPSRFPSLRVWQGQGVSSPINPFPLDRHFMSIFLWEIHSENVQVWSENFQVVTGGWKLYM